MAFFFVVLTTWHLHYQWDVFKAAFCDLAMFFYTIIGLMVVHVCTSAVGPFGESVREAPMVKRRRLSPLVWSIFFIYFFVVVIFKKKFKHIPFVLNSKWHWRKITISFSLCSVGNITFSSRTTFILATTPTVVSKSGLMH